MPDNKPRILIVDDERSNIQMLDEMLKNDYDISVALNGKQALKRVAAGSPPELILLDIQMPDMDGFAVCKQLIGQPETRDIPIIFITAMSSLEDEQRGLELGAVDYVTKPFHPSIVQARIRIHLDLKRQRDILNRISGIDGLTGVANRRRFDQFLDHEWHRCFRTGASISLIMADIDHFKPYNDHYGHLAGDDCLREVAAVLAATASRQTDLITRYGGEEFACIMPDTDARGAMNVAMKMHRAVNDLAIPHAFSPTAPHVSLSLGVGTLVPVRDRKNSRNLIETADQWLYVAKRNGRNQVACELDQSRRFPVSPGESAGKASEGNTGSKPRILLVDDEQINLNVLDAICKDNYETIPASNGEQALRRASQHPRPDMILLDIQMPDLDGYSVCQMLKNDPGTRDIPVLFITVRTEGADQSRGLALGAVDYITKPFHPSVVLARVKTHLRLKNALAVVAERNRELEAMLNLRASVERIVRSDLKKPLSHIITLTSTMTESAQLSKNMKQELKWVQDAGFQLLKGINRSLDLWKLERGVYAVAFEPVDLIAVLRLVRIEVAELCEKKHVSIDIRVNGGPPEPNDRCIVSGEGLLCCCILTNLVKNALEASAEGEVVTIDMQRHEEEWRIAVHNSVAIPIDIRSRFFEKGVTFGKPDAEGLSVYSTRLMAEVMGGSVAVETGDANGTTLTVRLPAAG
ncbi:MAG: response regulator [Deltaproteobacteria bacterium]|nr:response regulator [Deltaproteobacteria bacterium]